MVVEPKSQRVTDEDRGQERFRFGDNWQRFSTSLTAAQVERARDSLREMLGVASLAGKSFLDVGSGSGLFSLTALDLAAEAVRSFDFDPASVECAETLRSALPAAARARWRVERGDALDG